MVHKEQKQPRRTDQEWLELIQEYRTSGISDKDWCDHIIFSAVAFTIISEDFEIEPVQYQKLRFRWFMGNRK